MIRMMVPIVFALTWIGGCELQSRSRSMTPRLTMSTIEFVPQPEIDTGASPRSLGVADLDGDNDLDFVVGSGELYVFLNDGTAGFTAVGTFPLQRAGTINALVDIDQDSDADVVYVPDHPSGGVYLLLNDGRGAFSSPMLLGVSSATATAAIAADFDGDSDGDLVTLNRFGAADGLTLLTNLGDATFSSSEVPSELPPLEILAGDLDRDGDQDIVIAGSRGPTSGQPGYFLAVFKNDVRRTLNQQERSRPGPRRFWPSPT